MTRRSRASARCSATGRAGPRRRATDRASCTRPASSTRAVRPSGWFLQLTADHPADRPIPGWAYTFGQLIDAQSAGDFAAIEAHDLPIVRVHLGSDPDAGLAALERALEAALADRRGGMTQMRIGFIGLGRMGGNMVRRLIRDGHEVVAYNRTPEKTDGDRRRGRHRRRSRSRSWSEKLEKPRAVWVMVPAGDATEAQIHELLEHLEPGDTIIDGGNTNFHDDVRRHNELAAKGIRYVDAGTSGGVWGLKVGYCLMVGGDADAVTPLEPIFRTLAPEGGYLHVGGPGAGHYVKMVHNGIEYGLMQAYAEGFEIMHASDYDLDLGAISRAVDAGLGRALVAAGTARSRVPVERPGPRAPQGLGGRFGRGSLDRPGGDRPRRARRPSSRSRC